MTRAGVVQRCPHCDSLYEPARASIESRALALFAPDLDGVPTFVAEFFRELWMPTKRTHHTVKSIARAVGVLDSTLMSRFYRAGLPSPRDYVRDAGFVRAAAIVERGDMSLAAITKALHYSSNQSFGRSVRIATGMTTTQYFATYSAAELLDAFHSKYVIREKLVQLSPSGIVRLVAA